MESFEITSSLTNNSYLFKNDALVVSGIFNEDATTHTLRDINGTCYKKNSQGEQGEYVGNFNGYMRDGEIRYSLSDMSRRDSILVWDAIDGIERNVLNDADNGGE